jgi:hypothetical protein
VYKEDVGTHCFTRPMPSVAAGLRCAVAALSVLSAMAFAPTGAGGAASAAAATVPRPVILSVSVSPSQGLLLPAVGARVVVNLRVRNATTCTFLRQRIPFSALYPVKTVRCASGHASVTMPAIANPYKKQVRLTYGVRVRGGGTRSIQRSVTVAEAAAVSQRPPVTPPPPPPAAPTATLSISANSLPATGGSVVLTYTATNAASCSLLSTPALWVGADPATVDCNGTYTVTVAASTVAQQWTFTFTATSASGQTVSSTQTLSELALAAPVWNQSPNWSGYVVPSSALVTEASSSWTVPTVNCAVTPNGGASIWAGIGGYRWPTGGTSGALLQTGVSTNCVDGVPQYAGWFELYPSSPNTEKDFVGLPVSPGDSIEASVYQGSTGAWDTRVDDLTTGLSGVMVTGQGWGVLTDGGNGTFVKQGSTAGLSYSGGYTAEWIVEDYAQNDTPVPFADYGTVNFSGLTTSLTSWSLTLNEGLAIVQNGVAVSTPSLPANGGFSVSYTG